MFPYYFICLRADRYVDHLIQKWRHVLKKLFIYIYIWGELGAEYVVEYQKIEADLIRKKGQQYLLIIIDTISLYPTQ